MAINIIGAIICGIGSAFEFGKGNVTAGLWALTAMIWAISTI